MPETDQSSTATCDADHLRQETACVHCGLPCRNTAVTRGDQHFCCTGCQTVYEILTENGLGHFYQLNERPGVTIKRPSRREQFLFLDEPAVRGKLVDFSDGRNSRVTFQIPTIHCIACVWLLENLFLLNPGIGRSTVNFTKKEVSLQFEDSKATLSEVVTLLASLGYEPTLSFGSLEGAQPKPASRKLLLQLGLAGFAFGNVMLISISLYSGLDSQSAVRFGPMFGWVSLALTLPVIIYSAADYWRSAWTGLRQRMLTIELPIAAGLIALFGRSTYEIVTRTGEGYFDSLCGLVFFLLIGRWFQQKTYDRLSFDRDYKSFFPLSIRRRSSRREDAPTQRPETRNTKHETGHSLLTSAATIEEREEIVPLSALAVGDRLLLRHGELIPADARIISGEGVIDYSFVTGESEPVTKGADEIIYAGGQQTGGALEVQTIKPVSQSYLTSLWSHEAFSKERGDTLNSILNRFARHFTLAVTVIALATAGWWWLRGQGGMALKTFTSVLIVACPCALALSAPFALGTAQRVLGRAKMFLKNPHVIETLASVEAVVFDKTGTLTSPGAAKLEFHGAQLSETEERWLYSMTRHSTHPLPVRIGESIAKQHFPDPVRSFLETPGCGMEGQVSGNEIWMGAASWLARRNAPVPVALETQGNAVHVAINGKYRGSFVLATTLRPEVDNLITQLSSDYKLALLSGDNERERERFHQVFGPDANLNFNQSPIRKLEFIQQLQQQRKTVMMVGDGLNDAGALKQSNAGVAVVENIGAFSPASDLIIEASSVPQLAGILRFSKDVVRVVWISIAISIAYNVVGISVAATGWLSPVLCAVLMPLSSISVVAFACGATHWAARRAKLSPRNPNLTLNPSRPGPGDQEIKNRKQEVRA